MFVLHIEGLPALHPFMRCSFQVFVFRAGVQTAIGFQDLTSGCVFLSLFVQRFIALLPYRRCF